MSKKIIFIRHAKSSWNYEVSDKDRPLSERGINDAYLVATYLKDKHFHPEIIFSSPANRALHTCLIFLRTLDISFSKVTITDRLYDFSGSEVVSFLKSLSNDYREIMIFGHNHAFTSLVNMFGDAYINNVTTSGVVSIEFNTSEWASIDNGHTELTIFPKQLR